MRQDLKAELDHLYSLRTFGIKPGLGRMQAVLERIGNPEKGIGFVHVAGTNGKGSVCAMTESILRNAGGKTGLYISPHLVRLNERIQVSGKGIGDDDLMELIRFVEPHAKAVAPDYGDITFFEYVTVMAFEYYRRRKANLVVLETGMGGRLDATNVVTPLVSVITGIGIDHTMYLGDTIEKIAGEKAGIIKKDRPVIFGDMPPAAMEVMVHTARERGAPFIRATDSVTVRRLSQTFAGQKVKISSQSVEYPPVVLPLLGRHQLQNCAVAVAVVETLAETYGLNMEPSAVKKGLAETRWPGRCQVLPGEPVMILDGAHNPDAAERLAETLTELGKGKPMALVTGMMKDKDCARFLRTFSGLVRKCWTVTVSGERSMGRDELAGLARGLGWDVAGADLKGALESAKEWARANDGFVCIAGSLYLAGEVLELLGIEPGMDGGKRTYATV